MSSEKLFNLIPGILLALLVSPALVGCSQSGPGATTKGTGGSGATTSSGGTTGSGGSPGSGGSSTSGGASGAGGTTTSGGAAGSGGASGSGGATASGGTKGSGGASNTGGATGVGGTAGGSGTASSGGSPGSGGAAGAGGTTAAGGTTGAGGTPVRDGGSDTALGTGGVAGTGGTAGAGGASGTGGSTGCPALPTAPLASSSIIQFNDNAGYCWYQDERAVVDTKANKLVIGSVAFGGSRNGNIEAVIYDIAGNKVGSPTKLGNISVDDHNAPGIVITPSGNYVAMYAGHRVDCLSRWSIYNGTSWSAEKSLDWGNSLGCPWAGASTNMITYSNPWYMGSSIYSMVRSVGTDPAVLTSADDGQTWSYYGRLMDTVQTGYVAGYFKYWGNNTDRIDFVGTEAHPRDADTSLYHGYISGGKVYNSAGTAIDSSLKDANATTTNSANINTYTPVFKTGASVNGTKLCRMWNHDIVRYADGTVAVLGQGRADNCTSTPSGSDPDKRMVYFRFDGTSWKGTYLVKAGAKLYSSEEDYTGLSALDPDDPHIIYVSTTYDPRDDKTTTSKHELYQGVTCDNGATWKWAPLTQNSTVDNLRPIVPKWDGSHKALLWMKGTYTSAQSMTMAIVGTVGSR